MEHVICPKCGGDFVIMNAGDITREDFKLYTCQDCHTRFNQDDEDAILFIEVDG
jgi:transposase-like protein